MDQPLIVTVHPPDKKVNFYVAHISKRSTKNDSIKNNSNPYRLPVKYREQRLRIRIPTSRIISMYEVNKGSGYVLNVYISDSDVERQIADIDEQVKLETKNKNEKWFKNSLSDEVIDSMFRPAINTVNHNMKLLISETRDPNIYYDGVLLDSVDSILSLEGLSSLRSKYITADIEAQGLFFYPQRFGIRWIINTINIQSQEYLQDESDFCNESDWIDRRTIEASWLTDIAELKTHISQDVKHFKTRIEHLTELQQHIETEIEAACNAACVGNEWNSHLQSISRACSRYYSGNSSSSSGNSSGNRKDD